MVKTEKQIFANDAKKVARRPKVIVVGAGFGGLNAVEKLADVAVDIVLVDRDNYHGFWPLLYQVATSGLGPQDIARPIRAIFKGRQPNLDIVLGNVVSINLQDKTVCIEGEKSLSYDYLVLSPGSSTADFGIEGVNEFAFPLKTLPDATALRDHILTSFELADADDLYIEKGALNFVIAGGGPTGVEVAGALSELVKKNLSQDFHHLDVSRSRIILVETTDHLLGQFSKPSQRRALEGLISKGVEVHLGQSIASVARDHVVLGDSSIIPTATVIWTAGIRANPLLDTLGVQQMRNGAVVVGQDLSIPNHSEVFVIGDSAYAIDKKGAPLPQLAPFAVQGGRHVAKCIRNDLSYTPRPKFSYLNKGIMATIGRRSAVAEIPVVGLKLGGTIGWISWLLVHLLFLIDFRQKIMVLWSWVWNYFTWERSSRVIIGTVPIPHASQLFSNHPLVESSDLGPKGVDPQDLIQPLSD